MYQMVSDLVAELPLNLALFLCGALGWAISRWVNRRFCTPRFQPQLPLSKVDDELDDVPEHASETEVSRSKSSKFKALRQRARKAAKKKNNLSKEVPSNLAEECAEQDSVQESFNFGVQDEDPQHTTETPVVDDTIGDEFLTWEVSITQKEAPESIDELNLSVPVPSEEDSTSLGSHEETSESDAQVNAAAQCAETPLDDDDTSPSVASVADIDQLPESEPAEEPKTLFELVDNAERETAHTVEPVATDRGSEQELVCEQADEKVQKKKSRKQRLRAKRHQLLEESNDSIRASNLILPASPQKGSVQKSVVTSDETVTSTALESVNRKMSTISLPDVQSEKVVQEHVSQKVADTAAFRFTPWSEEPDQEPPAALTALCKEEVAAHIQEYNQDFGNAEEKLSGCKHVHTTPKWSSARRKSPMSTVCSPGSNWADTPANQDVPGDAWMIPLDEMPRCPEPLPEACEGVAIGSIDPNLSVYRPILSEDGQQLYTDGSQVYMLAGVQVTSAPLEQPDIDMTAVTSTISSHEVMQPILDPYDPMHQVVMGLSSTLFEGCGQYWPETTSPDPYKKNYSGADAAPSMRDPNEDGEEDALWNTCWDFQP